jgi:hypothetical protein
MSINKYIPEHHLVIREGLIVIGGVLIAAFVLSRFPSLQNFVRSTSITVDDKSGNNLY